MTKAEIFQENLQIERVVFVHSLSKFLLRKLGIQTMIGIGLSVNVRQKFSIILITWGTIHILRKHLEGEEGGQEMPIFTYFHY